MIVLSNGKRIAKDTPQQLYKRPELPLIASFFEEYNLIDGNIYYAHEIKIVEVSELSASVITSYFNGNSWLIEANYKDESIFIAHNEAIDKGTIIYFSLDS